MAEEIGGNFSLDATRDLQENVERLFKALCQRNEKRAREELRVLIFCAQGLQDALGFEVIR